MRHRSLSPLKFVVLLLGLLAGWGSIRSTPANGEQKPKPNFQAEFFKLCDAACRELNSPARRVPFLQDKFREGGCSVGVYGDIAWRACCLATEVGMSPPDAWQVALGERYRDPTQFKNAVKHTCPRSAFLGLCQAGLLPGIAVGQYTDSVSSSGYALAAVELLRAAPTLEADKSRLEARVFGDRTPNGEVDVVLTFWGRGLIR